MSECMQTSDYAPDAEFRITMSRSKVTGKWIYTLFARHGQIFICPSRYKLERTLDIQLRMTEGDL